MIGEIFTLLLLDPMVNLLVILNNVFLGSFGLGIIAFTILVRLVTFPLTLRQLHQSRAMQAIQPQVQEINKKYSDPKRRQEEIMRVYKESGVNPVGCVVPMLLQFPILIALYSAVRLALATSPEALEKLSGHLYNWSYIQHAVPLKEQFLWLDLRHPNMALVILVGATTWAQTKTTVTTITDERQLAQQQMMSYMMPLMMAFFALSFPAGVSLYWVVSTIVGIAQNVLTYGFPLLKIKPILGARAVAPALVAPRAAGSSARSPAARTQPARELRTANGSGRSKRQNRRRRP